MKAWIFVRIGWVLSIVCLLSVSLAYAVMPLPAGSKIFTYPATQSPVIHADPAQSKPMGVGNVTVAHDLALQVGIDSFSSPVDIYVAIFAPAVFPDLLLFQANGNLAPPSSGLSPWKAGTSGPVSEGLLGTIPLFLLPSGDYAFYLLIAPAGTQASSLGENCYLWVTSVGNLRVLDVSEWAASLFGGDVEAAATILMALGRGYSLENVAKSVMGGTLTEFGNISAATIAKQTMASEMPSFCKPEQSVEQCWQGLRDLLVSLSGD
jgi:hypothetical protein